MAPSFTLSFDYDGGGVAVSMRRGELEPGEPPSWQLRDWSEPVSFRTTAVSIARGGELRFVAGIQEDGLDVIERWTYPPRPGGYRIEISSGPPQPIGTPMGAFAGQEVLEGAEFLVPPDQATPAQRSVVYRGSHMGHVRSLVADPEGRFLLVLSYPRGCLYRLNLLQPGQPVLLHTAVDVPHLATATTLAVSHHVELGRQYTATEADVVRPIAAGPCSPTPTTTAASIRRGLSPRKNGRRRGSRTRACGRAWMSSA